MRVVLTMKANVKMKCLICGSDHAVEVTLAQFKAWQNGELIQNAMPDLSAIEQEQLITHICPKCQADFFKGED